MVAVAGNVWGLLPLDVGLAHHFAPARLLGADEVGELGRAHRPDQRTLGDHRVGDVLLAERLHRRGMHAVEQVEATADDGVAVFGCGPIGLAAIATLVDAGNERVVAVDPSATRRDLATSLGALAAVDPTTDDVWAALADLHGTTPFMFGPTPATAAFIEASGAAKVLTSIIERGAPGGRLAVVALHYAPIPTSFLTLLMKQFTVRGSMEYPARFEDAIDLLARRDLGALTTHRFGLDRLDDALALLEGSRDCGKVAVLPG